MTMFILGAVIGAFVGALAIAIVAHGAIADLETQRALERERQKKEVSNANNRNDNGNAEV